MQGTILDDDTVVQALEDLKEEAGDVAREASGILNRSNRRLHVHRTTPVDDWFSGFDEYLRPK